MRNVIYGINISIDGCTDHTIANPGEEIYEFFTQCMHDVDLIVYGRKTYELMIPYWPDVARDQSGTKAANEFAETFTAIDKIVFSKTLNSVDDHTKIVRDDLEGVIRKLKQEPGQKISLGGVNLPSQLAALGLIDEYYFVIHPLIVGQGNRLFEAIGLPDKTQLKLVNSMIFKSGCIGLHYLKQ